VEIIISTVVFMFVVLMKFNFIMIFWVMFGVIKRLLAFNATKLSLILFILTKAFFNLFSLVHLVHLIVTLS
jgi:hypothetical protein